MSSECRGLGANLSPVDLDRGKDAQIGRLHGLLGGAADGMPVQRLTLYVVLARRPRWGRLRPTQRQRQRQQGDSRGNGRPTKRLVECLMLLIVSLANAMGPPFARQRPHRLQAYILGNGQKSAAEVPGVTGFVPVDCRRKAVAGF